MAAFGCAEPRGWSQGHDTGRLLLPGWCPPRHTGLRQLWSDRPLLYQTGHAGPDTAPSRQGVPSDFGDTGPRPGHDPGLASRRDNKEGSPLKMGPERPPRDRVAAQPQTSG